ncbi:MAG: nitroreductase family protein [Candidatus Bathyarchaeia archaeon]
MELESAIKGRRSVRSYTDEPVPVELVRKVIEAGTWAPSGHNGQQWRFTVFTGSEKEGLTDFFHSKLQERLKEMGSKSTGSSVNSCRIMQEAPVLVMIWNAGGIEELFVKRKLSNARKLGHMVELQGVSAAIQNMLLMAYSLGLGSLWINNIYFAIEDLENYLDKPWELVAAVSLGWPSEKEKNKVAPKRRSVDEVSEFL